jgi:hypothetical protein
MALGSSRRLVGHGWVPLGSFLRLGAQSVRVVEVTADGDVIAEWIEGKPRGACVNHTRIRREAVGPRWRVAGTESIEIAEEQR